MALRRVPVLLAAAAVAAAGFAAGVLLRRADPPRPDIVVLLWDTTRADRLSAFGYARKTTPWLESLAARGILFEQCRAPSPWTLPSHASLFTGLLPRRHGALSLREPLLPFHETLAERLAASGYDTVLVSNNPVVGPQGGLDQGFGTVVSVPDRKGGQGVDRTREALEDVLAGRKNDPGRSRRPLFLFVNLMEPHLPYDPPEAIERPWRPEGATDEAVRAARGVRFPDDMAHNLGVRPLPPETLAILSSLYDAEIGALDDGCARIEGLLRREGVLDPADGGYLFAATSDHGENLGEHGLVDHKLSVAETLLRVPLVIHSPGRFQGGRRVPDAVRLQDLFPTLLEAAGVGYDAGAIPHAQPLGAVTPGGRVQVAEFPAPLSFIDDMRRTFPGRPEETFEPFRRGILAVIGTPSGGRRLKWVRTTRDDGAGGRTVLGESLFDLETDPGETRDLLAGPGATAADRESAARLAATAEAWTE